MDRALRIIDLDPMKSKHNIINGQVAALRLIAEIEQFIVRQTRDITKEAEGKTEAEMEFFCVNGYWPDNDVEQEQSGSGGSESPSKEIPAPRAC